MIYIEKNDKPNIIEKMLNLIKVQDSTIILPINEKTKEKQIEKIAKKSRSRCVFRIKYPKD